MILHKLVNVVAFTGAFYASHKLGVWFDPVDETETSSVQPIFNEEDKRRFQRAKEDLEKKICTKNGLCEPKPKSITESINDALYDTWLALKKIPAYWQRTADDISETISRWIGDDK